jgi:ferritin-like metal-binding protein YciE
MKDLKDLFYHMLKDVLYAEKQIIRNLPKMAKQVETPELKQAFETHRQETMVQVERLEQVFEMIGKAPRAETCEAIQGLVEEAKEVMEDAGDAETRDAGVLAAAQAVEHYEIARYGTLAAWADELGMRDAAKLLRETLAEEKKTDELLSKIALQRVNKKAKAA